MASNCMKHLIYYYAPSLTETQVFKTWEELRKLSLQNLGRTTQSSKLWKNYRTWELRRNSVGTQELSRNSGTQSELRNSVGTTSELSRDSVGTQVGTQSGTQSELSQELRRNSGTQSELRNLVGTQSELRNSVFRIWEELRNLGRTTQS